MNRHRLTGVASLLLLLLCFVPAAAQNQPSNSESQKTENSQKAEEAKEKERKEKARKDEEARLEAGKRKQVEHQKRRESDEAKAKEDNARGDEERKAQERKDQERKDQERKEIEKKEQDRKDEDRKHEEQVKEDRRKKEEQRKEDDRKHEEEKRKQHEARLEAQKRRQVEREEARRRQRERHDHASPSADYNYQPPAPQETVVIIAPPQVVNSTTAQPGSAAGTVASGSATATAQAPSAGAATPVVTASAPTTPVHSYEHYRQPPARQVWVGVLCAPGGAGGKPAVGFQYLTNKNYGVGVWFSGSFGQDSDVIDATIPHNDYYTESRTGTMGLEALCCVGSDAAMLVFGAGVSVDETTHTDISNATGWKWDGGSSSIVRPAAQVGCRFRLGGRVSLQFGYDTAQSSFFGLSAGF